MRPSPLVVVCSLLGWLLLPACASAPLPQAPPLGFEKALASETSVPPDAREAGLLGEPADSTPVLASRIPGADPVTHNFDALQSEGSPDRVALAARDALVLMGADGSGKRELPSELDRSRFALRVAARALSGDPARWEWLASLSWQPQADLAVLSIHDAEGRLVHEEVLRENCASLAWLPAETPELLVHCADRVWRYRPHPGIEPARTAAAFLRSGSFGPLRFGDSPARVRAALELAGASCRTGRCHIWALRMDERDFLVMPQFEERAGLARLTVYGPPRTRAEWRTKVRADWVELASELTRGTESPSISFPPVHALKTTPELSGYLFTETHHQKRDDTDASVGLYRNEDGTMFGAIAVVTPSGSSLASATPASPMAAAPPANAAD